ncbi:MAG: hypothetical protein ACXVA3_05285 [Vulcanimicrobiaceae bacterium]
MTELELQQRGLLDLVKNRGPLPPDPYLRRLAGSRELAMVREIAIWWRAMQLGAQCRFTSRLLKRLGLFEAVISRYFDGNPTSNFVEELSRDFLKSLRLHTDPAVRAVSQFEYALFEAHAASTEAFEICWDRNPDSVLLALENGLDFPPPEPEWLYRMLVAQKIPNMITCSRERIAPLSR